MYIVNMASGCTHEEAQFASLDVLDNISILVDKDNDFEEENTHFFKKTTSQALNILKTSTVIQGNF